jgi:fumarylacetoacetase
VPAAARPPGAPPPLPHLADAGDAASGGLQIHLQASLQSAAMRERGLSPQLLSRSNAADLYWTFAQMLAHHTSNGASLDTGDVIGSGTVSGRGEGALGSLLELTRNAALPLTLSSGEQRGFLHDGDEISLSAHCERPGFRRIGFGECRGRIVPARAFPSFAGARPQGASAATPAL